MVIVPSRSDGRHAGVASHGRPLIVVLLVTGRSW